MGDGFLPIRFERMRRSTKPVLQPTNGLLCLYGMSTTADCSSGSFFISHRVGKCTVSHFVGIAGSLIDVIHQVLQFWVANYWLNCGASLLWSIKSLVILPPKVDESTKWVQTPFGAFSMFALNINLIYFLTFPAKSIEISSHNFNTL